MVKVGQILNLSKIVVGNVNIIMGEYNVDVRVVNVESGTIAAKVGASFGMGSYREEMKKLAINLANKISNNPISYNVSDPNSLTPEVMEYLKKVPKTPYLAVKYKGKTYYISSSNYNKIPWMQQDLLDVFGIVVWDGEGAFAIGLKNAPGGEMRWSDAKSKYSNVLPNEPQAEHISKSIAHLNSLFDQCRKDGIDAQPMTSKYWTSSSMYSDYLGITVYYTLIVKSIKSQEPEGYSIYEGDIITLSKDSSAFVRPFYLLE